MFYPFDNGSLLAVSAASYHVDSGRQIVGRLDKLEGFPRRCFLFWKLQYDPAKHVQQAGIQPGRFFKLDFQMDPIGSGIGVNFDPGHNVALEPTPFQRLRLLAEGPAGDQGCDGACGAYIRNRCCSAGSSASRCDGQAYVSRARHGNRCG